MVQRWNWSGPPVPVSCRAGQKAGLISHFGFFLVKNFQFLGLLGQKFSIFNQQFF